MGGLMQGAKRCLLGVPSHAHQNIRAAAFVCFMRRNGRGLATMLRALDTVLPVHGLRCCVHAFCVEGCQARKFRNQTGRFKTMQSL